MDSDLAESISSLKTALSSVDTPNSFGQASASLVASLKERFSLPRRYVDFLLESDPVEVEARTPAEHVQLIAADALAEEQKDLALDEGGKLIALPLKNGWRPSWIVIAHSLLLGDPYFLDTAEVDAEGDCPVYTAMSGTDTWQPRLCASGFALFLRILAITTEVASDFDLDDYDPDNERVFREAVGPRIREVDPAAVKAGHWT